MTDSIQEGAVVAVGEAENAGWDPRGKDRPDQRSTKGKVAEEWNQKGPLLDPLIAQEREAVRMRMAGPRGSSMLNPNWEPAYTPYVTPAQVRTDARERLRQTVRVTRKWLDNAQDAIVDGSFVGVLPRPEREPSLVKHGVKVPPLGKEQNATALGPNLHVRAHPEISLYWDGEWTGPVSEEKAMRVWHREPDTRQGIMAAIIDGGKHTKGGLTTEFHLVEESEDNDSQ
jgi:hypothetical protein